MSLLEKITLNEQLANIGIEVYRMKRWENDPRYFEASFSRALDLLMRIIELNKNKSGALKELVRLKTLLIDAYTGGKEFDTKLDDLLKYFDYFINKRLFYKYK